MVTNGFMTVFLTVIAAAFAYASGYASVAGFPAIEIAFLVMTVGFTIGALVAGWMTAQDIGDSLRVRYTRNGGMRFLRVNRWQFSFCLCKRSI